MPKAVRICSKRNAAWRPRLSPASVITEKCGECTSTHCASPAKAERVPTKSVRAIQALRRRSIATPWLHILHQGCKFYDLEDVCKLGAAENTILGWNNVPAM